MRIQFGSNPLKFHGRDISSLLVRPFIITKLSHQIIIIILSNSILYHVHILRQLLVWLQYHYYMETTLFQPRQYYKLTVTANWVLHHSSFYLLLLLTYKHGRCHLSLTLKDYFTNHHGALLGVLTVGGVEYLYCQWNNMYRFAIAKTAKSISVWPIEHRSLIWAWCRTKVWAASHVKLAQDSLSYADGFTDT